MSVGKGARGINCNMFECQSIECEVLQFYLWVVCIFSTLVMGLSPPSHFDHALELIRSHIVTTAIPILCEQIPVHSQIPRISQLVLKVHQYNLKSNTFSMDRYLEVMSTVQLLAKKYGASVVGLLGETAFANNDDIVEKVLELSRLIMVKTDRTVIELNKGQFIQAKRVSGQKSAIGLEELDCDILEGYLSRALDFLISLTSSPLPFLLLPTPSQTSLHTALSHLLLVSELKGHSLSPAPLMHLSNNVLILSRLNSQTSTSSELVTAVVQKGMKSGCAVGMGVDACVVAPRKEKYQVQTNQLAHFAKQECNFLWVK